MLEIQVADCGCADNPDTSACQKESAGVIGQAGASGRDPVGGNRDQREEEDQQQGKTRNPGHGRSVGGSGVRPHRQAEALPSLE